MSQLSSSVGAEERLLRTLAEQLKLPLMQIARSAEFGQMDDAQIHLSSILQTADTAMHLIDSYLLSLSAEFSEQSRLELEPVTVGAVLQDVAHKLYYAAKQNDCELEVNLSGRYAPVMADRQKLEAAYVSLGHAFLGSPPMSGQTPHKVVLGAHTSIKGLVVGVYSNHSLVSASDYMRGRALTGDALQPIPKLSAYAGAGILVADSLLAKMHAPLKASRHSKMQGLAATLVPSKQLSLI